MKKTNDNSKPRLYAVKRGRCITLFSHVLPAVMFWQTALGSTVLTRETATAPWRSLWQ